jgi:hypothetical protein
MREGLRDIGRGTLGLAKWLAMTTLFHGALLAGLLLLGLAVGVVGRIDGWIRQNNISPSLLIAVTAWLSYSIAQEAQKQKTEQTRQRLEAAGRPKPPDPAG